MGRKVTNRNVGESKQSSLTAGEFRHHQVRTLQNNESELLALNKPPPYCEPRSTTNHESKGARRKTIES